MLIQEKTIFLVFITDITSKNKIIIYRTPICLNTNRVKFTNGSKIKYFGSGFVGLGIAPLTIVTYKNEPYNKTAQEKLKSLSMFLGFIKSLNCFGKQK